MMKKLLTAGICLALLSGCATQTYTLSSQAKAEPSLDKAQTFFVGGIGQEKEINAAEVCGGADKVAKVQTELSPLNALIGFLQPIYTPRQIKVYCK